MNKRSLIFVFGLTLSLYFVNQYFSSKEEHRTEQRKSEQTSVKEKTPPLADTPPNTPFVSNTQTQSAPETYYVLENDYQQLVFSNVGGALVEINLPLKNKENQASAVRPIGFDKAMEKDAPNNDRFPLEAVSGVTPKIGGYYPLLRRDILGKGDKTISKIQPRNYSLNIVSDEPEMENLVYTLKRQEKGLIEFEGTLPQRRIIKTFSFPANPAEAPYTFDLSVKVEGDSRGLALSSGVPEVELISGNPAPALKYRITRNKKAYVELVDLPKTTSSLNSVQPNWISNSNGFFGIIITPLTGGGNGFDVVQIPGTAMPTRLTLVDAQYDLYPAQKYPGYEMDLTLPSSAKTSQYRIYAGPYVSDVLQKVDAAYSDSETGYNPHYTAAQSFHGWFAFISEPFAKFLMLLMRFFYLITHSWGFSIILLTIALRIMLYPLNAWSIKSSAKMQQAAPEVARIQEKYKKEPKKAQMEVMNLYKEKGINPITGCFPILIQMPFLIGMFDLLKSTFQLRGASFIPGWIDNLTAPDVLFSWHYPVVFFGTNFHLLPILLGAVMYFQQKLSSPIPKDAKILTDQQKQQKMMGNIMTIVFAVMFYHFPSGLNLYWLSSMLLGILQQWWMTKKLSHTKVEVEVLPPVKKK